MGKSIDNSADFRKICTNQPLEENLVISDENHNYIKNVLRMSHNEELICLNGQEVANYSIVEFKKRETILQLLSKRPAVMPRYKLILYQSITKKDYFDSIVFDAAQVGVTKLVPFYSKRSSQQKYVNKAEDSQSKFIDRAKKQIHKATIQSGREDFMDIVDPKDISDIDINCEENILFHYGERVSPCNISSSSVSFVIGPEGGFEKEEIDLLISKGFKTASPMTPQLKAVTAVTIFTGMLRSQIDINLGS